jgi:hypothetical protein
MFSMAAASLTTLAASAPDSSAGSNAAANAAVAFP